MPDANNESDAVQGRSMGRYQGQPSGAIKNIAIGNGASQIKAVLSNFGSVLGVEADEWWDSAIRE